MEASLSKLTQYTSLMWDLLHTKKGIAASNQQGYYSGPSTSVEVLVWYIKAGSIFSSFFSFFYLRLGQEDQLNTKEEQKATQNPCKD